MAEKEGFEPSIPFWGIHDFQSCALGQLRDFSKAAVSLTARLYYIIDLDLSSVILLFLKIFEAVFINIFLFVHSSAILFAGGYAIL